MPPATGRHLDHADLACAACHGGQDGLDSRFHVNGAKDVSARVPFSPSRRLCATACHGPERWDGQGGD